MRTFVLLVCIALIVTMATAYVEEAPAHVVRDQLVAMEFRQCTQVPPQGCEANCLASSNRDSYGGCISGGELITCKCDDMA